MTTIGSFGMDTQAQSVTEFTLTGKKSNGEETGASNTTFSVSTGDTVEVSEEALALLQQQKSGDGNNANSNVTDATGENNSQAAVAYGKTGAAQGAGQADSSDSEEGDSELKDTVEILKEQIAELEKQIATLQQDPEATGAKTSQTSGDSGEDAGSAQTAGNAESDGIKTATQLGSGTSETITAGKQAKSAGQEGGESPKSKKLDSLEQELAALKLQLLQAEQDAENSKLQGEQWA